MKRFMIGGLLGAVLLGAIGLAQGELQLPPAKDEIAAMEQAFGQVTSFFRSLITEFKASITMLTGRLDRLEAIAIPVLRDHEARLSALEKHDLESLQRRLLALDQAIQGMQVKVDHNRAKIEGLEVAIAGFADRIESLSTALTELGREVTAAKEAAGEATSAVAARVEALEKQLSSLWPAVFLVPIAVGALLYLLTRGG